MSVEALAELLRQRHGALIRLFSHRLGPLRTKVFFVVRGTPGTAAPVIPRSQRLPPPFVAQELTARDGLDHNGPQCLDLDGALSVLLQQQDAAVQATADEISTCALALFPTKYAEAALQREFLAAGWPWAGPRVLQEMLPFLVTLVAALDTDEEDPHTLRIVEQNPYWPGEAAPAAVAKRFEKALNQLDAGVRPPEEGTSAAVFEQAAGDALMQQADAGLGVLHGVTVVDAHGALLRFPGTGLALLHLAARDIDAGRRRRSMAIDAGKDHHSFITGWKELPRDGVRHKGAAKSFPTHQPAGHERLRVMLFDRRDKQSIQLQLPLPHEGLHANTITALRNIRGAKGLRHWCALQRLLSIEGGRRGWVRWSLDQHLEAMGYESRIRRDPDQRRKIADEVAALTELELVAYSDDNQERHRAPLLLIGNRFERLQEAEWQLEGMELRINDLLYSGVRDPETGKLGGNWLPVPIELAQVDHVRHPYAHALGLLIAIRMRWDLWDGKDHVSLKARTLLNVAGITFNARRPSTTWQRLERELSVLCDVGLLAHCVMPAQPWDLEQSFILYPSQWILDRTHHRILPDERPPLVVPLNGGELRAWRDLNKISVRELSKQLGIARNTISGAERVEEKLLSPRFHRLLREFIEKMPLSSTVDI